MIDRVVWESRHKFVYYDEDCENQILDMISNYPAKLDSDEPIVVYIKDDGLPKLDSKLNLESYSIRSFHNRYFELLIFLAIIDILIKNIDKDILDEKLSRMFRLCSYTANKKIDCVVDLREMLSRSIDSYREAYVKYQENGELNFYETIEFPFLMMYNSLECLKDEINLKKYFALLIEIDNDTLYNQMAINNYIASRCNGCLSVNVLCSKYDWKYYYSSNGQLIEYIYDYTKVDLRKNKDKVKSIHI